jgi:hypothetical protein
MFNFLITFSMTDCIQITLAAFIHLKGAFTTHAHKVSCETRMQELSEALLSKGWGAH